MNSLKGAIVVVTGAGRGIGHAVAQELGAAGACVVVNYRQSKEEAEALAATLQDAGAQAAVAIQADVADSEQAAALVEETVNRFDRLDVLVNNAGINIDRTMKNLSIKEWEQVVHADLNSYFYTVKAALPIFMRQEDGRIINISSFVGQMGNFGQANYSAAKAGIIGFTKTAALELARYHVTVNAVCPGFIETDMYTTVPEAVKDKIVQRIPLGRVGTPHEVARAVRFLIEDGAYITGQTLNVNGGIYM
jgi:acetoacetyl-CoA reductase